MKTQGSLPCSQQPANSSYPETYASSPNPLNLFPKIYSNIIFFYAYTFASSFQTKILINVFMSCVPDHLIFLKFTVQWRILNSYRAWYLHLRNFTHHLKCI
jgi:hypothetical protein